MDGEDREEGKGKAEKYMQDMIYPNSSLERKEDIKKCNHRCGKIARDYLGHLKICSVSYSSINEILETNDNVTFRKAHDAL